MCHDVAMANGLRPLRGLTSRGTRSMTTRCPTCGGEVNADQRFCTYCGTPIGPPEFAGSSSAADDDRGFGTPYASDAATDPYLRQAAIAPSWALLAGAGRRVAAYLIDTVIVLTVGGFLIGLIGFALGFSEGFIYTLIAIFSLLYFIILEGTRGQTLGKQLLGIRVVRLEDGQPITMGQSVGRNLLRIVDALPFWNLLGFLLIVFQSQKQRVGDLAAKTVVVRS
jgi:uncharacterized RDD family membrane protein YckC